MRDIRIRPILNGWIVKAGCQELCFTDARTLGMELTRYVQYPQEVEKEYLAKAVNQIGPTTVDAGAEPACDTQEERRNVPTEGIAPPMTLRRG
jgi:hypothetical protein